MTRPFPGLSSPSHASRGVLWVGEHGQAAAWRQTGSGPVRYSEETAELEEGEEGQWRRAAGVGALDHPDAVTRFRRSGEKGRTGRAVGP